MAVIQLPDFYIFLPIMNQTPNNSTQQKPAVLMAISWFIFAGTATFTAIFLPIHIFGLIKNPTKTPYFINPDFTEIFIAILIFSIIFHSLYRLRTILLDFGFPKIAKTANIFNTIIILIVTGILIYSVFTLFQ